MTRKTKIFGYWTVIHDRESALYAVRMAGLPALIIGGNIPLLALVNLGQHPAAAACAAIIAVLLIVLAFRIRSGHAAWIPLVLILCTTAIAITASNISIANLTGQGPISTTLFLIGCFVPLICLVLTSAGFKGWLWLKRNKVKTSF